MIEVLFDAGTGIIRIVAVGLWSCDDIDDLVVQLGSMVGDLRRQQRPVRMLIDITGSETQAPETEAHIQSYANTISRPGDRTAIVVKNNLLKGHMRNMVGPRDYEIAMFCSVAAAETWLMAFDRQMSA